MLEGRALLLTPTPLKNVTFQCIALTALVFWLGEILQRVIAAFKRSYHRMLMMISDFVVFKTHARSAIEPCSHVWFYSFSIIWFCSNTFTVLLHTQ